MRWVAIVGVVLVVAVASGCAPPAGWVRHRDGDRWSVHWSGMTGGPWRLWYADEAFEDCTDIDTWPEDPQRRKVGCPNLPGHDKNGEEVDGWFPASPGMFPTVEACVRNKHAIKLQDVTQSFCCVTRAPKPLQDDQLDCPEDPDVLRFPIRRP